MKMIARRKQIIFFLIEFGGLLCEETNVCPSGPVSLRNPSCAHVSRAIEEELGVFWMTASAE